MFRRTPHHRPLLAAGPGLKPGSGPTRESAKVAAAEVGMFGWDVVEDGTDDVNVHACARRLVDDGLQFDDDYLVVKKEVLLLLLVLVMSAGPCVDMHVYLHSRVRVNRDENAWTEMR